jgi:hypothetical protein
MRLAGLRQCGPWDYKRMQGDCGQANSDHEEPKTFASRSTFMDLSCFEHSKTRTQPPKSKTTRPGWREEVGLAVRAQPNNLLPLVTIQGCETWNFLVQLKRIFQPKNRLEEIAG